MHERVRVGWWDWQHRPPVHAESAQDGVVVPAGPAATPADAPTREATPSPTIAGAAAGRVAREAAGPALRLARRSLLALWLLLSAALLALVVMTHVSGALGYRLVIVRGPSMSPTIPLGALAFERTLAPTAVAVGDVVTLTLPSGAIVTHRVVRVTSVGGEPYVETQGDASAAADPTLQPASRITGRVEFHLPIAGFILAYVTQPTGLVSTISLLGSLLAVIWLLEAVEADRRAGDPAARVVEGRDPPA